MFHLWGKDELNKLGLIYTRYCSISKYQKVDLATSYKSRMNNNHFSEFSVDQILKSRYMLSLYCWGHRDYGEGVHICGNIPVKSRTYILLFPKGNLLFHFF